MVKDTSVLTAGGLYEGMPFYDDLFNNIEKYNELTDFSISYDYGAELNSMASLSLFLKTESYDIADRENSLI